MAMGEGGCWAGCVKVGFAVRGGELELGMWSLGWGGR